MKSCKKCGIEKAETEFHKHRTSCKDCYRTQNREMARQYYADPVNRERHREMTRQYYADPVNRERNKELSRQRYADPVNRERIQEVNRQRYADPVNRERIREASRQWAKDNPEYYNERNRRRYAIKNGADADRIDLLELFERDNWICYLCGEPVDQNLKWPDSGSASHDHVIPLSKGGSHTWDNVKLAHLKCNLSKGAKLLEED